MLEVGGWEQRKKGGLEEEEAWGNSSLVTFFFFSTHYLKKGVEGPCKLVMNDDITFGSPTAPASRPKRH